jgi:hypothetical protein
MYVSNPVSTSTELIVVKGTSHRSNNPYQTPQDFLSNVGRFKIIESTLRGLNCPGGSP